MCRQTKADKTNLGCGNPADDRRPRLRQDSCVAKRGDAAAARAVAVVLTERGREMLHLVRRFAVRIVFVALLGLMAAGFALPAGQASARTSEPTDSQIL